MLLASMPAAQACMSQHASTRTSARAQRPGTHGVTAAVAVAGSSQGADWPCSPRCHGTHSEQSRERTLQLALLLQARLGPGDLLVPRILLQAVLLQHLQHRSGVSAVLQRWTVCAPCSALVRSFAAAHLPQSIKGQRRLALDSLESWTTVDLAMLRQDFADTADALNLQNGSLYSVGVLLAPVAAWGDLDAGPSAQPLEPLHSGSPVLWAWSSSKSRQECRRARASPAWLANQQAKGLRSAGPAGSRLKKCTPVVFLGRDCSSESSPDSSAGSSSTGLFSFLPALAAAAYHI